MPVSVTMPRLGESVTEGTVTRWLKKEGERIEADEPLLEVSTDKVDTEIPSPASGVLTAIKVGEDETVDVGAELAVISDAAGETPAPPAAPAPPPPVASVAPVTSVAPAAPVAAEPAQPATEVAATRAATPDAAHPDHDAEPEDEVAGAYVTPLVRKLATEHGVDLSAVRGTGVGGRIRKQDVLEAVRPPQQVVPPVAAGAPSAASTAVAPATPAAGVPMVTAADALRGRTEKMSRVRAFIAERMVDSLRVSAQLTTVVEVDVTRIARIRQRAKTDFEAREGVRLSFLPFFALAAVEALKQHPKLNASIDIEAGTVTYHDAEHLGIAVDSDRGLLVPVIHDAGYLNLAGLARKIADLAVRSRANRISPDEMSGGTFTLTNTGSRGALFDTPIINQPQVAILGTGTVVKRPVVIDDPDLGDVISVRSMVFLSLTYDHRLVDGADAVRFLGAVKERLEAGQFESDLGLG